MVLISIDNLTEKEILLNLKKLYRKAKKSLVNLRLLFSNPNKDETSPAWFHHVWSEILLRGTKHFCIEAFRESAKSEYIGRGNTIHSLMFPDYDRNYIVYIYETQTIASKRLKDFVNEYLSNPDYCANLIKTNKFSEDAFEAIVTNDTGEKINVRLEAYGKGSSLRGITHLSQRPKLVICDDLQGGKDMTSEVTLSKDWSWFLSDVYFLGKSTRIFIIGNNLGEKCIVERIINKASDLEFEWMRIPITGEVQGSKNVLKEIKGIHSSEEDKSNWEAHWPLKRIEKEKEQFRNVGSLDIWLREKMCIAINPETQIFRQDMFKYYDPEMITEDNCFLDFESGKKEKLSIYTMVDPAISKSDKACYSAIVTVGANSKNHWFVMDIKYGHFDPSELVDNIFSAAAQYEPVQIGIEDAGFQMALRTIIMERMPKKNIWFDVVPMKHGGKAKEVRIQGLQPRFACGSIWFKKGASWCKELESEMIAFKSGIKTKVDLLDALAYSNNMIQKPSSWSSSVNFDDIPVAGSM